MPREEDIARRDTRDLLVALRDQLSQPPLSVGMRRTVEAVMDLLGEQDIAKRLHLRVRIDDILADMERQAGL
jgi:hypothetical protein